MNSEVEQLLSRAESLIDQFDRDGERYLIEEAITLDREALKLCPSQHPTRWRPLLFLSNHLSCRYREFGEIKDIEEGIVLLQESLHLLPPEHPDSFMSLENLAFHLSIRYRELGAMDDIEEAISLNRQALILCPPDLGRLRLLDNIASCLYDRYLKHGSLEDLDESASFLQDSLALCPPGHPKRSLLLHNSARGLHVRYQKLSAIEDLDEAIARSREALDLCPPGEPNPHYLIGLSAHLQVRFQNLGEMENLDEAIVLNQQAVTLCPLGHPIRSYSLIDLSQCLYFRYAKLENMDDLAMIIDLDQEAISLCPPGHTNRTASLGNLSRSLYKRYKKIGKVDDLDKAIALDREALDLCQPGHPGRSICLMSLADHLYTQLTTRLHGPQDEEELFNLYAQLVNNSHAVSSADLSAAKEWIVMAEAFKHSTTTLAYETYLRLLLLHLAALPSLPQHLNLVKDLTSSFALDAFSAALRSRSPIKAVELLEQGRGVFINQLARLRSPVDDVIASGSDGKILGDRYLQLTSLIRKTLESPGANQHDQVWHLNIELKRVLADIRKLPGFSHFLQPPLFSYLRKAAVHGPVVIVNASKHGCDALVVFFDQDPIHVSLQITRDEVRGMTAELHRLTKQTKITKVGKYFAVVMRELWKKVVSSIVDVLMINHPLQSRIWWCPTAEFSVLPLHAAGMYRTGQHKFSDFYISSYTSSLAALVHAREQPSTPAERKHIVGIGQANAAGESVLQSISSELMAVGERVNGHAVFTRMEGSASSIADVMEALGGNQWVHLACHGLPQKDKPFESAFGLYDGRLTVESLLHCDLRNAEFAYLSACHTTAGDEDCLDEMIHLASAIQFAGFRSVIGTMWAVDDEQTVKITSKFYEKMINESGRLDHTRAAYALHQTMREVSDLSFDQRILYVHFGV